MNSGGSIRSRLLLIALVPVLALLPLGLRGAVDDYRTWRRGTDSAEAANQFSESERIAEVVRFEWLAGLDLAATLSGDFTMQVNANVEGEAPTRVQQMTAPVIEEAVIRFAATSTAADTALASVGADMQSAAEEVFGGRAELHERLENGRVIPAELDLYYERALRQWHSDVTPDLSVDSTIDNPQALNALNTQQSLDLVIDSGGRMGHELTIVFDRILEGGLIDWEALRDASRQLAITIRVADGAAVDGSSEWQESRRSLEQTLGTLNQLIDRSPASSAIVVESDLEIVATARAELLAVLPQLGQQQEATLGVIVAAAETERTQSRGALALSGLLLGFVLAVIFVITAQAHRWIAEPLREAAALARSLSRGQINPTHTEPRGPREVQEVLESLDGVIDTVAAVEAQAMAITSDRPDDPVLTKRLPGQLGRTLEGSVGQWRDVTKRLEHELAHDTVTGLARHRHLMRRSESLADEGGLAIAVIGLDRFKGVNDMVGREAGDAVLRQVAKRITRVAPKDSISARLWSDEFAVVVGKKQAHALRGSIDALVNELFSPVVAGDQSWRIHVTVGIAEGDSIDDIITDAITAVRWGKQQGGGLVVEHDDAFVELLDHRALIESELGQAIEDDLLRLWFQPVVDLETNEVVSLEALVRWPMDDGSLRLPDEFIPVAEQSDLIIELDRWVINEACRHLSTWSGGSMEHVRVAVNLSGRHINRSDLVKTFRVACERHSVDPSMLIAEVTESYLVNDAPEVRRVLDALQSFGIRISLDDFGTGYSSLAYVQEMPFDVLKIDRTFIEHISSQPDSHSLISGVVGLAKGLGLETVAEGVTNEQQLDVLRRLGCDKVQGYLTGRPMPVGDQLVSRCAQSESRSAGPSFPTRYGKSESAHS